jgi:uncharacterized protein (TIGR00725 family)
MLRRPVIGVMGGAEAPAEACALAEDFGRLAAQAEWIVLCGGRPVGIMDAVARGAHLAGGFVVGILPGREAGPADASAYLDLAVVTGIGDARNAINVLSSDVVVACAGGPGTVSEVALALKCGRRVVLLGWEAPAHLFSDYVASGALRITATAVEAQQWVAQWLARQGEG